MKLSVHGYWLATVLISSLCVSGCSMVTQTIDTAASVNPFQQQAAQPTTKPAEQKPATPVVPSSIRVEVQPKPAQPEVQQPTVLAAVKPQAVAKPVAKVAQKKPKKKVLATNKAKQKRTVAKKILPTGDVEVTLGSNKECTTFCALPLRKPPVQTQPAQ